MIDGLVALDKLGGQKVTREKRILRKGTGNNVVEATFPPRRFHFFVVAEDVSLATIRRRRRRRRPPPRVGGGGSARGRRRRQQFVVVVVKFVFVPEFHAEASVRLSDGNSLIRTVGFSRVRK